MNKRYFSIVEGEWVENEGEDSIRSYKGSTLDETHGSETEEFSLSIKLLYWCFEI